LTNIADLTVKNATIMIISDTTEITLYDATGSQIEVEIYESNDSFYKSMYSHSKCVHFRMPCDIGLLKIESRGIPRCCISLPDIKNVVSNFKYNIFENENRLIYTNEFETRETFRTSRSLRYYDQLNTLRKALIEILRNQSMSDVTSIQDYCETIPTTLIPVEYYPNLTYISISWTSHTINMKLDEFDMSGMELKELIESKSSNAMHCIHICLHYY
jgi:hypothetical protein